METEAKARILIVDDEPDLVKLLQSYLKRLGYSVDTSHDAEEALALVDQTGQTYDLLVADVTLPRMSGKELALKMTAASPNLKVLLTSGYPVAVDSMPESLRYRLGSLDKPFLPNMLVKSIEELLQRPNKK
ncbi:MAG TPA: response regulator [Bryobacteraceae bacterium]|nr:response regulator [Bryobacteraceae bacterium]